MCLSLPWAASGASQREGSGQQGSPLSPGPGQAAGATFDPSGPRRVWAWNGVPGEGGCCSEHCLPSGGREYGEARGTRPGHCLPRGINWVSCPHFPSEKDPAFQQGLVERAQVNGVSYRAGGPVVSATRPPYPSPVSKTPKGAQMKEPGVCSCWNLMAWRWVPKLPFTPHGLWALQITHF